jgi:1-acyl-sn-glycerol-3-phosphate acyltransferase
MRLAMSAIYPTDGMLFRMRWQDIERIPVSGGVILAVNHLSQLDTLVVSRLVWQAGRIPRFIVKQSLYDAPVMGRVFRGAEQIPVARTAGSIIASLDQAAEAVRRGECVIVYPEGTITQDPGYWPMQAKSGIARLAMLCPDAPVIPVGQWGAQRTLGRNARFRPVPRPLVTAQVGEPMDLDRFRTEDGRLPGQRVMRTVTAEIMAAVTAQLAALRPGETPPEEPMPWTPPPTNRELNRR